MLNTYEQKQQDRADRYRELAITRNQQSNERFNSNNISTVRGMMGEPVKVGHHSEGRHRRLLEKADNDMRKSFELQETANYYEEKANTIENSKVISSDDPDAILKLTTKLEKLQLTHADMKKQNADARKAKTQQPCPSYMLTNSNARIKNVKLRIAKLKKASTETSKNLYIVDGCTVYDNVEDNRLQLLFDEKPSDEVRSNLKSSGFRWSPRASAWQRQRSNSALYSAKRVLNIN